MGNNHRRGDGLQRRIAIPQSPWKGRKANSPQRGMALARTRHARRLRQPRHARSLLQPFFRTNARASRKFPPKSTNRNMQRLKRPKRRRSGTRQPTDSKQRMKPTKSQPTPFPMRPEESSSSIRRRVQPPAGRDLFGDTEAPLRRGIGS